MEWTDAAQREIEQIHEQIRSSLDPNEVDPAEVISDIQRRIEEELSARQLHTITAENVRSAATKIGIQDIISEPPTADTHKETFERGVSRPRRIKKRFSTGCFWFFGIILPLVALGVEIVTRICMEAGLPDPLPTPFHALLIALVPLACILGRRFIKEQKTISIERLGLLLGVALSVSMYNTLLFITVTPFAIVGLAAIIFGVGLLALLPLSPLLSGIAILFLNRNLKQKLGKKVPCLKTGLLWGAVAILIASSPMYITKLGLQLATSENPTTQTRGVKLLRVIGDKALMNQACYRGGAPMQDPISWLITGGQPVEPGAARDIYYRVTGRAFNTKASPTLGFRTRRNPGDEFDWDPEQGGDVVAGRLKGLSLSESRMDGLVNADAATAYLEWTMVFHNNWDWEREARAQIALPEGAVVSRLTLWVDGEEREAAFGGRSQVKQAYKEIVQQRRDPVLVTTSGPDRVLMQCFPVPAQGTMKVRIGITAPLTCLTLEDRRLRLPHLVERNFRIPKNVNHAIWIENYFTDDLTDTELNAPTAQIRATSKTNTCWTELDKDSIRQQIQPIKKEPPKHLAVVLDTSIGMKGHFKEIDEALAALPAETDVSFWVADDEESRSIEHTAIEQLKASGGKDNAQALRKALTGPCECVLWIHAAQEWDLGSSEIVRQVLERTSDKQLLEIQVTSGPNRLIEKMDTLTGFHSIPRYGSFTEDLKRTLAPFSSGAVEWKAVRERAPNQETNEHHTDDHLVRLWALDTIHQLLEIPRPNTKEALKLAQQHHLVTPISGAVVLETQQQFVENNLEPVSNEFVPSVPEPASILLLLLALLLLFYGRRITAHIRAKLEIA